LARGAQKRETGSIESEGDLRRWIWGYRSRIGDSENLGFFSPKFTSSHFSLNVTFLCKLRRIRVLRCALEFLDVANSVFGTPFCVIKLLSALGENGRF